MLIKYLKAVKCCLECDPKKIMLYFVLKKNSAFEVWDPCKEDRCVDESY